MISDEVNQLLNDGHLTEFAFGELVQKRTSYNVLKLKKQNPCCSLNYMLKYRVCCWDVALDATLCGSGRRQVVGVLFNIT